MASFSVLERVAGFMEVLPPGGVEEVLLLVYLFIVLMAPTITRLCRCLSARGNLDDHEILSVQGSGGNCV